MPTTRPLSLTQVSLHCLLPFALMMSAATAAMAADVGCDAKRENLEQQLEHARENGQSHREAGLQRALSAVEDHCTTQSLIDESRETLEDLEDERREQRDELEEAKRDDDSSDIAKHQRKLEELDADIQTEQRRLQALKSLSE